MGKIFVFIGPSSSGKDTIYKIIRDDYPDLKEIILYTTRPIREGETEGKEYHFISKEEMDKMQKENRIIERRDYNVEKYGIWSYATSKDSINLLNDSYITINTIEGYKKLRKCYDVGVIPIFIRVPDDIRLERAMERERQQANPKFDEIERRFKADAIDFSEEKIKEAKIDNFFDNNNLYSCVYEIEKFMDKTLEPKQKKRF